MKMFQRFLNSKKILLVNVSLVSLLIGSLFSTVLISSCRSESITIFARSANTAVLKDKVALNSALTVQRAFRNIAKTIGPAVVSIQASRTPTRNHSSRMFRDDFFRRFFEGPFGGYRRNRPQRKRRALGSGFIFDKKGYLLTNYHVVKGADEINVIFQNGRKLKAKLIGRDKETDIAVLKIKPFRNIPVVSLGDSDRSQVGDWAIAIGNPFGLSGTFTTGVISAKSRGEKIGAPYQNFLQVDTAINPGNSGGPLANIRGEVIGINTMIYTRSGGSLGIGFAIPINIARTIVAQLVSKGHFVRGYLGIYPAPIKEKMRKALKLPENYGVLVNKVIEDGPAFRAGFKDGDVILKISGKKMTSVSKLMQIVAGFKVGQKVHFEILRKWKRITISVRIGKRPTDDVSMGRDPERGKRWLGLRVVPSSSLSGRQLRMYGIPENASGMVVTSSEGLAADSGIARGDLIVSINYIRISSASSYSSFIRKYGRRNSFIFKILRQGRTLFLAVSIE